MNILKSTYFINKCDYSFGVLSSGKFSDINLENEEFIKAYDNAILCGKEFMTLFVDSIRLYRRYQFCEVETGIKYTNMENPGLKNWESNRTGKNILLQSVKDQDLLKLCESIPNMKFIIFTGFEDVPIDNEIFDKIPENVLKIYSSNAMSFGGKVVPIPFGIHSSTKDSDIIENIDKVVDITNLLYINHRLHHNAERYKINEFYSNKSWVGISSADKFNFNIEYIGYLMELKKHKFVLCCDGNAIGCDCYRVWETLYMRRVPVVENTEYFRNLFNGLPVLFVDNFFSITEELLVNNEYLYEMVSTMNMSKLDASNFFDVANYEIVDWIKNYAGDKFKLVVGISGGIDSALVSTLCAMTGIETHVVTLPIYQKSDQLTLAREHIKWLKSNFKNIVEYEFDLTQAFDSISDIFSNFKSGLSLANSRSRLRMLSLYHISSNVGGIVVGTGNKVEDFGVGFFTKYGDGGVDISPIADLTKSEVRKMAKDLGVIDGIISAKPTDGLWEDDRSDEDQIGATYEELEWAMEYNGEGELNDRQKEVFKIYNRYNSVNKHKMIAIPVFKKNRN
jgi:NAD+ synthase